MRCARVAVCCALPLLTVCGPAVAPAVRGPWAPLGGYETTDEATALTRRHGTDVRVWAGLTARRGEGTESIVLYTYSTHEEWRERHAREDEAAERQASGCDAACSRCAHHGYPTESIHRTARGGCAALHLAVVDLDEAGQAKVQRTLEVEPYVCAAGRADLVDRSALEATDVDGDGRSELRLRYAWATAPEGCTQMRSWFRTERIVDLGDLHEQARVVLEDGTSDGLGRGVSEITLADVDRDGHQDLRMHRARFDRSCALDERGWPRRAPEGQAATAGCTITDVREDQRWDAARDLWVVDPASRRETTIAGLVETTPAATPGPGPAGFAIEAGPLTARMNQIWQQYGGGRGPLGSAMIGSGTTGATQDYDVDLDAGLCYTIIGVAEESVSDLDMFLFDPQGTQVAQDQATDNFPIVQACPTTAGRYRVQLKVYAGQGNFAWQAFSTGISAPPTPAAPPPVAGTPPATGIPECDAYVARACNCNNPQARPVACQAATMSAEAWRAALAASPAARDPILQGCATAESALRAVCTQ